MILYHRTQRIKSDEIIANGFKDSFGLPHPSFENGVWLSNHDQVGDGDALLEVVFLGEQVDDILRRMRVIVDATDQLHQVFFVPAALINVEAESITLLDDDEVERFTAFYRNIAGCDVGTVALLGL